eukprot:TRINITY_DN10794_c0_g2_i3.p1 TRINITY_DN10794_c0_g2~~TRINITY_DN10794_c0_g2_i3.p1  ORF type:complete len:131 (-),score=16.27 TRINITY_DN10794_c0_g2_i3:102-494(-)
MAIALHIKPSLICFFCQKKSLLIRMAALVLRIKFPVTYPLIYKTLRVDANFTVKEAVQFIAETVNVTTLLTGSEGLFVPDENTWLDDQTPLSNYTSLQDAEHIEFKDRRAATPKPDTDLKSNDGCDCVLF